MGRVIDNVDRDRLARLIDDATTSVESDLNPVLIRSIKNVVRLSDANVRIALDQLLYSLRKKHSQVRYLAVLLVDQLFCRSKLFRSLLVQELEEFMRLTVGYRAELPLPPPAEQAAKLRSRSLEFLQRWDEMFGKHYRQLRLAYEYLSVTLRIEFPTVAGPSEQVQRQRQGREERTRELLRGKFEALRKGFPEFRVEIQSTLNQIQQCLDILGSKGRGTPVQVLEEEHAKSLENIDEEGEEVGAYGVRGLRRVEPEMDEPAMAEVEEARETADNEPVFDTLRDLSRIMVTRHVASIQEWLSTLMRVDPPDRRPHDALLREVIDLRNKVLAVQNQCQKLGIQDGKDYLSDVVWEVEEAEESVTDSVKAGGGQQQKPASAGAIRTGAVPVSARSSAGCSSKAVDQRRRKGPNDNLLSTAPVLPWGSYLDSWGAQSAVPANSRGLLLESHWGKVDYDVCLPADRVADLTLRASIFETEKREIMPCLAPLKKGGLCQRRDLHTCPFHGRIVPRDACGKPIADEKVMPRPVQDPNKSETSMTEGTADAQCEEAAATSTSLARQAVANVRGQDDKELKKRKRASAQARQDRQHNDMVLRTAAISRSAQGFEELLFPDGGPEMQEPAKKKSKASLSSMLRKKPTVKDRLAKRLLNGRVTDASVEQSIRDQEASYREAFANQW